MGVNMWARAEYTAGAQEIAARRRAWLENGLVVGVALACAYAMKASYCHAGFDALRWMLAPTMRVVEWLTGATFELEAHHGYLSRDLLYQVVPACAGVNFLIIAFGCLTCGLVQAQPSRARRLLLLPLGAAVAYVTTILANATRIALGMYLHAAGAALGPLTPERVHHLEGVVVYFGYLSAMFTLAVRCVGEVRDAHVQAR
jgi:exosortase K